VVKITALGLHINAFKCVTISAKQRKTGPYLCAFSAKTGVFDALYAPESALWSGENDIDDIVASILPLERTLSGDWRENGNSFGEGNAGAVVDKSGGGYDAVSDGAQDGRR
jgi:hypothetical protein